MTSQIIQGKRFYQTPSGNKYPSITTVLSSTGDKSGLLEWRKRIGDKEADAIIKEACNNGTAMHDSLEQYMLHKSIPDLPNNKVKAMVTHGIKVIDKNINHIVQTEAPLYSNELEVAGRTDAIVFWNNQLSILDWKNRGKKDHKSVKSQLDYKLQIAFYAQCVYELTNKKPKLGIVASLNIIGSNILKFDPFDKEITDLLYKRITDFYTTELSN